MMCVLRLVLSFRLILAATACLVLTFAFVIPVYAQTTKPVILVGDFVNKTGDPKWDGVGVGIADAVTVKLRHISSLIVIRGEKRGRVMTEQHFGQSELVNAHTAAETGKLVNATQIAYGFYTIEDDQLSVSVYFLDCTTEAQEGNCVLYGNMGETALLIDELSLWLVNMLGLVATNTEAAKVKNTEIGTTIDTLALMGEVNAILSDNYGMIQTTQANSKLKQVKDIYEQMLTVENNNSYALSNLGAILLLEGNFDRSIKELRKAIKIDPDNAEAHYNLGNALSLKGDFKGAIAEFKKAIEADPEFHYAHIGLGGILLAQGDLDSAIAEVRKAIEIEPDDAMQYCNLGNILSEKGDLDGAIVEYLNAIAIDPDCIDAHYNLGNALYNKGNLGGAIVEYKKAIAIDPNYAQLHNNLGIAYEEKSLINIAITEYKKAVDIDPSYANAWLNLGLALASIGHNGDAVSALRKYIENTSGDPYGDHEQVKQWIAELGG